jgi:MiaB/RimO family radical SAM methylthiotransferase
MKTFCVETLGCKVNHYEGEQIAALLRSHGLVESEASHADLRVVNTCSVTTEAGSKSRQTTRRLVKLPLLTAGQIRPKTIPDLAGAPVTMLTQRNAGAGRLLEEPSISVAAPSAGAPAPLHRPRVIVTGCWATDDPDGAAALPGVDAVVTHHVDVAAELERLLTQWDWIPRREEERGGRQAPADLPVRAADAVADRTPNRSERPLVVPPSGQSGDDGWMTEAGTPAGSRTAEIKAELPEKVNLQIYAQSGGRRPENPGGAKNSSPAAPASAPGTTRLPLLGERQAARQRAVLKVQDGCDAHCTYCIIPRLRPALWSKPVGDAVEEARRLVAAGHVEVVLTGIFLGAYGHDTALRRRRGRPGRAGPLAELVAALCARVPGLRRLRLSSLEPGDLTDELLAALRGHEQVVPHFHLPLQSGSDVVLRRMNRQYTRQDFLRMVDRVRAAFDPVALTTDVIVGFPGETAEEFARTVEVVDRAAFIHVHAFPFSPRPGTAAARRTRDVVRGPAVNERVQTLRGLGEAQDLEFRRRFVGRSVAVLVERGGGHGRCEYYFDVRFDGNGCEPGDFARVRVEEVTPTSTHGTRLSVERPARGTA